MAKICDFGNSKRSKSTKSQTDYDYDGTINYRAPELLLNNPNFSNKIDIWALGCVVAQMALG